MVNIISGMNFLVEALNINYADIPAAFSFRANPTTNTNILYRDPWATGSSSGILNSIGGNGFFLFSGTGNFNTTNYFELSQNYSLNDSTILISYEKLRTKNEILLSSITGNSPNTYAGFNIGINDANKLYLKYWNSIEGSFTFTYTGILSDKNILAINRNDSILTLGHFNNNTFEFSSQEFEIFQNNFINNNKLFVGGNPNSPSWDSNDPSNFSGYIDRLYIFNNIPFIYANALARGLFSEPTGFAGELEEYCYVTGFLSGSGYSYSTITGVLVSGFESGITGITGYDQINSGYLYTGITGYSGQYLGSYIDNCGNDIDIVEQIALSGEIYNEVLVTVALTGITFVTGFTEVDLVGIETGIENVFVTGLICDSYFNNIGDVLYKYDDDYLSSLSYKEISLLTTINPNIVEPTGNDIIEIYAEDCQPKTLEYNKNLSYDTLNENYFYIDRAFQQNEVLMFGNGQALIDNGYELIPSGYETIRSPKFDYFITGTTVETNKFFGVKDSLFYDYFSGRSSFYPRLSNIFGEVFYQSSNSGVDAFVFKNGQKLISGIDYSVDRLSSTQVLYGSGFRALFGSNLNINDDGDLLIITDSTRISGFDMSNNCYIYKKLNGGTWALHQTLTGLLRYISGENLNFQAKLSKNGKVLVVSNRLPQTGTRIDIFTGSKNDYWYLNKTLNISGGVNLFGFTNYNLNFDGSIISYYNISQSISNPWVVGMGIITGNPNVGDWNFDSYQNVTSSSLFSWPSTINSGIATNQLFMTINFSQNKNMDKGLVIFNVIGGSSLYNSLPYKTFIKVGTGNMLNWNSTQSISGEFLSGIIDINFQKIMINDDFSVMSISEPQFSALPVSPSNPNREGRVAILTGGVNSSWIVKQTMTGEAGQSTLLGNYHKINDDGSNLFISSGSAYGFRRHRIIQYKGNSNIGWSIFKNFNTTFPYSFSDFNDISDFNIDKNGSTIAFSNRLIDTASGIDAGGLHVFGEGMNLYFLNEEFSNQLNYFMVREIDHYNNYISGESGTLRFPKPFNHGCSQVFYNGIKQKINSNYVENSKFDLISGVFNEPNEFKRPIYNNTDDFFV